MIVTEMLQNNHIINATHCFNIVRKEKKNTNSVVY